MTTTTAFDELELTDSVQYSGALRVGSGAVFLLVSYTRNSGTDVTLSVQISDAEAGPWYTPTTKAGVALGSATAISTTGDYRFSLAMWTDGTEILGALGPGETWLRLGAVSSAAGVSAADTLTVKVLHTPVYGSGL